MSGLIATLTLGVTVTKSYMARKGVIVLVGFTFAAVVATVVFINDYHEADRMAFDGWVQSIEWNSQNHGLPLVSLRTNSGVKLVQHFRLDINKKLKSGDRFSKSAGSHECAIDGVVYVCVH